MTNNSKYDLEERTAKLGESVILLLKKIQPSDINKPLINQLVRCSTSVGANYSEADDAESKEDFRHKIGICKKESRETKHFLRMLAAANPELKDQFRIIWQEANEINLIFNSIFKKVSPFRH